MTYEFGKMCSPVGELCLVAGRKGLVAVLWGEDDYARVRLDRGMAASRNAVLEEAERQLREYFSGDRKSFDLPLDFQGTDFQVKVWHALLTIPFGETRSYGEIARQIGQPGASRAVGAANGRNPISIIAPCHRVVGSNGKLTGFAGGLRAKQYLLDHEAF